MEEICTAQNTRQLASFALPLRPFPRIMPATMPPTSLQPDQSTPLRVGWFTASCVLVSNIIGGGIFTTTGILARDLGDPLLILLLWFMGALFAVGGAMVYGELGSRLPHAGGDYVYLKEAYGPLLAFLSGWTSFTIGFGAAVAASAISFSSYAMRVVLIPDESGWIAKGLSLTLLWSATLIHCRGIGTGGRLQLLLTTTKVVAIGGLILGGLSSVIGQGHVLFAEPMVQSPTLGAAAIALVIVTYCYLGWNVAGYIAADIENPRDLAKNHDRGNSIRRRGLSPAECGVPVSLAHHGTGTGTYCAGGGESRYGLVGAAERAAGCRDPLSLYRGSGQRDDLGRTPCLLGHGTRRHDQPLARPGAPSNQCTGPRDRLPKSLGFAADSQWYVRTAACL